MGKTSIGWTAGDDGTPGMVWNCLRGCSRVSPGCGGAAGVGGCYAEKVAARFSGPGLAYEGLARWHEDSNGKKTARWTGKVRELPEALDAPLHWRKPRRIFVNSMSDVFHDGVSNEFIAAMFGVMAACPQHTFQILTKRAERPPRWFEWVATEAQKGNMIGGPRETIFVKGKADEALHRNFADCGLDCRANPKDPTSFRAHPWPLPNVWLGVSAENQATARERIPYLLRTPAAVRWVSYEPALGPIEFFGGPNDTAPGPAMVTGKSHQTRTDYGTGVEWAAEMYSGLDWIVAGSESGTGRRPADVEWFRSVRDQCERAGIPFFLKQMIVDGRKVELPMLDGRRHDAYPPAR